MIKKGNFNGKSDKFDFKLWFQKNRKVDNNLLDAWINSISYALLTVNKSILVCLFLKKNICFLTGYKMDQTWPSNEIHALEI